MPNGMKDAGLNASRGRVCLDVVWVLFGGNVGWWLRFVIGGGG